MILPESLQSPVLGAGCLLVMWQGWFWLDEVFFFCNQWCRGESDGRRGGQGPAFHIGFKVGLVVTMA